MGDYETWFNYVQSSGDAKGCYPLLRYEPRGRTVDINGASRPEVRIRLSELTRYVTLDIRCLFIYLVSPESH